MFHSHVNVYQRVPIHDKHCKYSLHDMDGTHFFRYPNLLIKHDFSQLQFSVFIGHVRACHVDTAALDPNYIQLS